MSDEVVQNAPPAPVNPGEEGGPTEESVGARPESAVVDGGLHIALTIAGAVALGAFEGGALAALIKAIQGSRAAPGGADPGVTIDAIGAASAGSITAAAAAKAIACGVDPVTVMYGVWVNGASAGNLLLKGHGSNSPLTMDGLAGLAKTILTENGNSALEQASPVYMSFSLTNLRGLAYRARQDASEEPVPHTDVLEATTYQDWAVFKVDSSFDFNAPLPNGSSSVADAALASGASPLGFSPRTLTRTFSDYHKDPELYNFPCGTPNPTPEKTATMWYSDGGDIDNEPLGRTLNLSNRLDEHQDGQQAWDRLHLLIHPFPDSPPAWNDQTLTGAAPTPKWLPTLVNVLKIIRWQSLYDDVQNVEIVNKQLKQADKLNSLMEGIFGKLSQADRDALKTSLESEFSLSTTTDVAGAFSGALGKVGNIGGKNPISIEVVSPYLAQGTAGKPLDKILAGERWSSFFGLFDKAARSSDFALGYVCMLNWMDQYEELRRRVGDAGFNAALQAFCGLEWQGKNYMSYGLSDSVLAQARKVTNGPLLTESWEIGQFAGAGIRSLGPGSLFELVEVIVRTVRAVL